MPRPIATALSAVTILALGLVALSYRQQELAGSGLTGQNAEAFNLTTTISGDAMTILGNAIPLMMGAVVVVMFLLILLVNR